MVSGRSLETNCDGDRREEDCHSASAPHVAQSGLILPRANNSFFGRWEVLFDQSVEALRLG